MNCWRYHSALSTLFEVLKFQICPHLNYIRICYVAVSFDINCFLHSNVYSRHGTTPKLSIRKAAQTLPSKPQVLDRWEINPGNVLFGEKIGKGAFGQVYSAEIEVTRMSSMFKGMRKTKESQTHVQAAVKVLKGDKDSSYK